MTLRTSHSHPLQIAEVPALPGMGAVGITFCPGKVQPGAMTGMWQRDLAIDLDAVRDWGAAALVTLVEAQELESLQVTGLGEAVRARHMIWYHIPIRDVSVPSAAFEQAWLKTGAELRSIIASGFKVLVHCKGGLGRAGMIAARLLVELGLDAQQTISAVRRVRPGAIETAAQAQHVLSLQPVGWARPDTSPAAIRDRAVGALLGLAVGDALGTTLEFKPRDSYALLIDMVGGGPFRLKAGQWTDDTSMALALADTLADPAGFDEQALMNRFVGWQERGDYSCTGRCFDIGNTVRGALTRFQRTGDPIAGSTDNWSAGNGSLMRLAPVAIRYWHDRRRLRDCAARQSRTTHGAPEAVDACVAYAEILADAISGQATREVLAPRPSAYIGQIGDIVAGRWRGKLRPAISASGYVVHSLEAALWSVGRSGTFADAVLTAANLGEDADTTAAIAGQLAGALYGASAIPAGWLGKLAWHERIVAAAEALLSPQIREAA